MRYDLYEPDGTEIGFITDEPEFRWELREDAPFREQIERVIKRSAEYEMVVAGGEEPAEDAVTPPEEDVPVDDYGRVVRVASELPNEAPVQVSQSDEQTKGHIAQELVHAVEKVHKERVYVEDESEIPEGVEPQEGRQGGIYYETEQLGDEEDSTEPWTDASFEDLGSVLRDTIGEENVSQLVEELPEDADPKSTIEQLTNMMSESEEFSDEDINNLYRDLGEAFGDTNPEEAPDPEDVGLEIPGNLDAETAVDAVSDVLGRKAANALFGDMRASDSGEAPNPDSYVAQAAQNVPKQARSELQESIKDAVSGDGEGGESESEGESEEESQESGEDEELLEGWSVVEDTEGLTEEEVKVQTEDGDIVEGTVQSTEDGTVQVETGEDETQEFDPENVDIYTEDTQNESEEGGSEESSDEGEEGDKAAKVAQKALEERFHRMENERRDSVVKVEELNKPDIDIEKNRTFRKAGENFVQVDNLLMEAFEKQIWQDDLTKAPDMWERDDNVPQFVRSHVKEAIDKTDVLYSQFDNIPHTAALKVHEIIKDQLTDPQGWSVETVTHALEEEFEGLAKEQAESIARTEIAATLNKARELAYSAAQAAQAANESRNITGIPETEGPEDVDVDEEEREIRYYWAGPEDSHTTKLCSSVKDEIESRGGYVTKDELKNILREKAEKYEEESGALLNRIDSFLPHFNCRHTFIREDYQRVT